MIEEEKKIMALKAGKIFKAMGYTVEYNRRFRDHVVDIFVKMKKTFSSDYEYWICFIHNNSGKVCREEIERLISIREIVREELLKKESNFCLDCQAIIISEIGFTKEADAAADKYSIELYSFDMLVTDYIDFIDTSKRLIKDLYDICSQHKV